MARIVRQSGKLRKKNENSRQTRRLHMGHFYLALLIIIVFVTQTLLQPKKDVLKNSLPTQSSSLHKVAQKEKQEEPNNNNNLDAKSDNGIDTIKTSGNSETAETSETSNNSENPEDPKNPTVEEEEEAAAEEEGVSQKEIPSNKEPSTDTIDVVENKDNENEASPNENGSSLINVDESTPNETETGAEKVPDVENTKPKSAPIHSLRCDENVGPDNLKATKEMAYWSDIPSDATFVSPFKREGVEQYVTFEPDAGAFNNMRMAWENIVVFALATGRTLVLLPERIFPYITDVSNIYIYISLYLFLFFVLQLHTLSLYIYNFLIVDHQI